VERKKTQRVYDDYDHLLFCFLFFPRPQKVALNPLGAPGIPCQGGKLRFFCRPYGNELTACAQAWIAALAQQDVDADQKLTLEELLAYNNDSKT
jgi:hypothetical protein